MYRNKNTENLDGEVWKAVVGFDGYSVSNMGRVKGITGNILSQVINGGYLIIGMTKLANGKKKRYAPRVHRLVADAFCVGNINNMHVHHVNHIKTDNRAINLEILTASENKRESFKNGYNKRKLSASDIVDIRDLLGKGIKQADIASEFNIRQPTVSEIKNGKRWSYIK